MSGLSQQVTSESATLLDLIHTCIRSDRVELNVCMPAIVKSYDSSKQTCKVQPVFKRSYIDKTVASRPIISDVPVVFPRTGKGGINFPVESGDTVLLVFSQRSLDDWLDSGGEVELTDFRLHNISDAVAIVGLYPSTNPITPAPSSDATEIRGSKLFIGDHEAIPNPASTLEKRDLVEILIKLVEQLLTANYASPAGATTGMLPPNQTTIEAIKAELENLKA